MKAKKAGKKPSVSSKKPTKHISRASTPVRNVKPKPSSVTKKKPKEHFSRMYTPARNVKPKPAKALILLSGGLDSRLVCKMLQEQLGSENVEAVFFALPFGGGCCSDSMCVVKFCQKEGIRLHIVDFTKGVLFRRYMAMVRKPKFSRGVGFNPCIDCHLFMLREAKKLANKIKADFLATGEVLGERPLSQNRPVLGVIEKEAGLEGMVLRPLSAKLLAETDAERKGWVKRERLLSIHGRRRVEQLELARRYKIDFPTPGGGCLLTDLAFSERLLNLLKLKTELLPQEVELVKLGRHFAVGEAVVVVGRNHQENIKISAIAKELGLPTLEVGGAMGPTTAIWGKAAKTVTRDAALLTARYSDAPKGQNCHVSVTSGKNVEKLQVIAPQDNAFLQKKR